MTWWPDDSRLTFNPGISAHGPSYAQYMLCILFRPDSGYSIIR